MHRLSALLANINIREMIGTLDPEPASLAYDSRRVQPGSLFFALPGVHVDGHEYVPQAVANGAAAIVISRPLQSYDPSVTFVLVDDVREAMSALSAAFFDFPSEDLIVIGVTGTDGKSSTVSFIHQLLEACGETAGFLSTVEFKTDVSIEKNPYRQSTPESPEIHGILARMRDNGKNYAVIESTSHGLSKRSSRLADVLFNAAVLTNVTLEHLEFHKTLERYREDKANLFRALDVSAAVEKRRTVKTGPFGVVNLEDPNWKLFSSATSRPVYGYSTSDRNADLFAEILSEDLSGTDLVLHKGTASIPVRFSIPGPFNVDNLLASLIVVSKASGRSIEELAVYIPSLKPVNGRMHSVLKGQPFSVLVDYAHTPGAFKRLFPLARRYTDGRLIAVFGSGGERDLEKRPQQGAIASEYCNLLILTNEDPRLEDPIKILEDIAAGCDEKTLSCTVLKIPDRRSAIRTAFEAARPGDSVLLLGKGHEASIILDTGPILWNEAAVAEEILTEMGYRA